MVWTLCILCNNWSLFVPRELMPNIAWHHFSQSQSSFLAHIYTDWITILDRDRQTDLSRPIITINQLSIWSDNVLALKKLFSLMSTLNHSFLIFRTIRSRQSQKNYFIIILIFINKPFCFRIKRLINNYGVIIH